MLQGKLDDLVQSSIDSFEIQPDLLTLDRINDYTVKLTELKSQQLLKLSQINNELKNQIALINDDIKQIMTQKLISQDDGHNIDLRDSINPGADTIKLIDQQLNELDNLKLSLAKNLNDLERLINLNTMNKLKLQGQLDDLKANHENLINENLLKNRNSNIMKIKLYKSLGSIIESTEDEDKIIMYNENTGVDYLKVNNEYSDYFISNYIWDKI